MFNKEGNFNCTIEELKLDYRLLKPVPRLILIVP